jgi:hypothetical protein
MSAVVQAAVGKIVGQSANERFGIASTDPGAAHPRSGLLGSSPPRPLGSSRDPSAPSRARTRGSAWRTPTSHPADVEPSGRNVRSAPPPIDSARWPGASASDRAMTTTGLPAPFRRRNEAAADR